MTNKRSSIPASVVDPFYRYRRQVLQLTTLQKKGGQTVIENLITVSRELGRTPEEIVKWFQKVLPTRGKGGRARDKPSDSTRSTVRTVYC